MDSFEDIIDSISTKGDLPQSTRPDNAVQHPCHKCGGTGKFLGVRVHQHQDKCFACGGNGYFKTSKFDRDRNRTQAAARKVARQTEALAAFDEQYPALRATLAAATWSDFAQSLHASLTKYGNLTEKQLTAAINFKVKVDVKAVERVAEQQVKADIEPTLARLAESFLTSAAHLKFPKLRLRTEDGLAVVLTRAGERSKEAGSINLTDGGPYGQNVFYGRISPQGTANYRNAPVSVIALLERFNSDPQAEIKIKVSALVSAAAAVVS